MTFVKTKIELSKLQPGDILEVLLAEGEPLDNVPRNAKEQGYNVLSVFKTQTNYGRIKSSAQCDHCYRQKAGNHHQDRPTDGLYHPEITSQVVTLGTG